MKDKEIVLLINEKNSYLVEKSDRKIQTAEGIVNLKQIKKIDSFIKSHTGKIFFVVKPNLNDILKKRVKRMPQVIMTKDASLILAYTGVMPGSLVVDAGSGTGYLSIFLANYLKPGKVVTYEKERKFAKVAKENFKSSGLDKFIKLKQKNILKGIDEKNADLVTLDMKNSERVVKHAYAALKYGGWLVIYSPYIEQVKAVVKEIKKKGFSEVKTVENIVRFWDVGEHTLPQRSGIMHTGFMTFARKVK
jgi:tRNA (adenine57-N1/adenine58-N1)-methyltransferase catalytic subunit